MPAEKAARPSDQHTDAGFSLPVRLSAIDGRIPSFTHRSGDLGFYVGSDLHKHAMRIAEEFSTIDIAQEQGPRAAASTADGSIAAKPWESQAAMTRCPPTCGANAAQS